VPIRLRPDRRHHELEAVVGGDGGFLAREHEPCSAGPQLVVHVVERQPPGARGDVEEGVALGIA
jgi:hypothetical protein